MPTAAEPPAAEPEAAESAAAAAAGACIAHVNSETGFSGGEHQVLLLMRGLRARGYRNVLLCRPGSRSEARARQEGFEVHCASMRNELDLLAVLQLRRALRRCGAAVVNLHTGRANWLGGWAARLAGVPAVTIRRMDRRVRRGLRTRLIYGPLTRAVVAISPAVTDCLVAAGVPREAIELIPDAIDPDALRPRRDRAAVRRAEGIAADRPVLLALASLDRRKGIDVLLDALAGLRRDRPELDPLLLVAGAGPEQAALERQIAALDLRPRVRLLGRRDDAPDLLGAADVFVLPSRREGMGVAALEAMAAGLPVVASRVGGLQVTVREGETGLLVPPEDPAALAAAIARLLDGPDLRAQLAARGPAHVAAHYHVDQQVARYEQLYRRLRLPG